VLYVQIVDDLTYLSTKFKGVKKKLISHSNKYGNMATCFSPLFGSSSGYQIGSFQGGRHLHKVCMSFVRSHGYINNILDCPDEKKLVKRKTLKTRT
jgi:hypothetical protein